MAYTPRALALRLDRLSRRAHRFHRYAHHPLCRAYSSELIALGRTRICRGCAYVASGALLGLALASLLPAARSALVCVACAGALSGVALVAGHRGSKLVTRFLPALALSFESVHGLRVGGVLGHAAALASVGACIFGYVFYRVRGPDRSPCAVCPERTHSPCSGLLPILRRERAFQRVARKLLA